MCTTKVLGQDTNVLTYVSCQCVFFKGTKATQNITSRHKSTELDKAKRGTRQDKVFLFTN
jgi:hypothetical protein